MSCMEYKHIISLIISWEEQFVHYNKLGRAVCSEDLVLHLLTTPFIRVSIAFATLF